MRTQPVLPSRPHKVPVVVVILLLSHWLFSSPEEEDTKRHAASKGAIQDTKSHSQRSKRKHAGSEGGKR